MVPSSFTGKAGCHGEVFFSCLTTGKLRDKRMVGGLALSGDETTGGIFVKSMNDAWAVFSREFAELSIAVMQQSIDECATEVARTGMDNKSARFVDDNDVLVFETRSEREYPREELQSVPVREHRQK
jgi:hypothetical protein